MTEKKHENPAHWDDTAATYERTAHPFTAQFAEEALARVTLTPETRVLDVAAGTGALALAAARSGAQIVATDFSPGMVARIAAAGLANVEARVMDGQALDLPDASFDISFSIFGVIMFPDWRKGLAEMARVTRPGGLGVLATWQSEGAATFLLLSQIRRRLFPKLDGKTRLPEGAVALGDPEWLSAAMVDAGFQAPRIDVVVHDFELDVRQLDTPDELFGMSPDWLALDDDQRAAVVAEVRRMAEGRAILPIPSTALIAVAAR
ncbi:class I SAM-dependent methyltransferase [Sphingomonas sp. HITSZ_GF]|uniref:class I SAM-dependent methyltransferase n=1 Tax=Sphingomonas sp. HITSZ_GF TaxID=3037247 RepID=UPI00240E7D1D|nr:class I SAM-dependent methyltransferase [Sphingomonas sp. HITSZ_GF]MDG2534671.1 class I SAM-dependent methyltransferase [Sphingomonas sp. HITSZ_GF]